MLTVAATGRLQRKKKNKIDIDILFGKKIRELRDEAGVLQRQLAALLEIDTPMFSKIEHSDRRAKREQVIKLAEYFHQDENEMLTLIGTTNHLAGFGMVFL